MNFVYPTDEQLGHVDIFLATTIIYCSLSTLICIKLSSTLIHSITFKFEAKPSLLKPAEKIAV